MAELFFDMDTVNEMRKILAVSDRITRTCRHRRDVCSGVVLHRSLHTRDTRLMFSWGAHRR